MHFQNSTSLSKRVLEEAWICLLGLYGRSFEAQYGSINGEQFSLWLAGLATNDVTDEMVAAAVSAIPAEHARRSSHPPNFADFLRLCMRSQLADAASEDQAFKEANAAARNWDRHQWSSNAVYHATLSVGVWSLRQFPEKVTRPKFGEAYRKLIEQQRAGQTLDAPPSQAASDRQLSAPKSIGAEKLKSRRQQLNALSSAILELPLDLQRVATEALKTGVFVSCNELLPEHVTISDAGRALLLEFCCNVKGGAVPAAVEQSLFAPTL
jgi:hypothetical protein